MTETLSDPERTPVAVVDPGQLIRLKAHFPDGAKNVRFSYLPPGEREAIHDPGSEEIGTKITHKGDLFTYWLDTRDMNGGVGWWCFYSEDPVMARRRSKIGTFLVRNDVPSALMTTKRGAPTTVGDDSGLYLLGADSHDDATPDTAPFIAGLSLTLLLGVLFAR